MKTCKIRYIIVVLVGTIIYLLLHFVAPQKQGESNELGSLLTCIIITFLVWEGNILLDLKLNNYIIWEDNVKMRVVFQLLSTSIYTITTIYLSLFLYNTFVCKLSPEQQGNFLYPSLIIGLLTAFIILSVELSRQFFKNWKESLLEVEKYKTESVAAQLQNLKSQLNPHFLFNNLSVLSSLVYLDQDKAVEFINQLSKVYRYLLDNKNNELISLKEEMKFMESYFYLLKIRFGENIHFNVEIDNKSYDKCIPPLSLQILVENAMKHNQISSLKPLYISIESINDTLKICNNLQLREVYEPSSKIGIANIKVRYSYFTEKEIELLNKDNQFCVLLPLLSGI